MFDEGFVEGQQQPLVISKDVISKGTNEECSATIEAFIRENENVRQFPQFKLKEKDDLWGVIINRLKNPITTPEVIRKLLNMLRILSRDPAGLDIIITEERVSTLLEIGHLKDSQEFTNCSYLETLECLKVIFNLVFQSEFQRVLFMSNGILEGLAQNIKRFRSELSNGVKYFMMRITFVITALCPETGPKCRNELKCLSYIIEYLEEMMKCPENFDDETTDVLCEMLKVLYNLIRDIVPGKNEVVAKVEDEEDQKNLQNITLLVRKILMHQTQSSEKKLELDNHAIDLLAAVSFDCYSELIPPVCDTNSLYTCEGYDMTAIELIANFLQQVLEILQTDRSKAESLSPILCILTRIIAHSRLARRYLKQRILPPLKKEDIVERPEIGNTLRNRLCILLTSPSGHLAELAANLLFILCKENVKRMIKYTGYGNAAGLLANRGLLLGGNKNTKINDYSASSDDSDTEEYREVRHLINDVEGWLQPERPSPCEGMTEEQKEYEAMKLVNAIDQLNRSHVIQPCTVGRDGRPRRIEHILELQEQEGNEIRQQESDSDSN